MEIRALKPYIVVICLLALTSMALAFTVDVSVTDQAGVRTELPARVGDWVGDELRFCQNPSCQEVVLTSAVTNRDVCPKCEGKLDMMSKPERDLLPLDTIVQKKKYEKDGQILYASIVMSGSERSSIHRPQTCLVGQGNEIVGDRVQSVPMPGRDDLDVMVLDMLRRFRTPDGRQVEHDSYYAYWFAGKGRETPYHLQRMMWMATDRIFHNVAHRWAYISVSGNRDDKGAYLANMRELIGGLYPQIVLSDAGL